MVSTDQPEDWRPKPEQHIQTTQLSAAHPGNMSGLWVVSISTPIYKGEGADKQFLGVIGVSFELAKNFINLLEDERDDQSHANADKREPERLNALLDDHAVDWEMVPHAEDGRDASYVRVRIFCFMSPPPLRCSQSLH